MISYRRNTRKNKLTDKILDEIKDWRLKQTPYCVLCHSRYRLQLGHLISRVCKSVVFEPDNLHIQCARCNSKHETDPKPFENYVKNKIGLERFNKLKMEANKTKSWKVWELEELLRKWKNDSQ